MEASGETCKRGHERTPETAITFRNRHGTTTLGCRLCYRHRATCRDCDRECESVAESLTGRCYGCQQGRVETLEAMDRDQLSDLVDLMTARLVQRGREVA